MPATPEPELLPRLPCPAWMLRVEPPEAAAARVEPGPVPAVGPRFTLLPAEEVGACIEAERPLALASLGLECATAETCVGLLPAGLCTFCFWAPSGPRIRDGRGSDEGEALGCVLASLGACNTRMRAARAASCSSPASTGSASTGGDALTNQGPGGLGAFVWAAGDA